MAIINQLSSSLTIFTKDNHGLITGDHVRLMDLGNDNPLNLKAFWVRVLDSSNIALYQDSSLTIPVQANGAHIKSSSDTIMATWLTPNPRLALLNRNHLVYKDFPDDYIPQDWGTSWVSENFVFDASNGLTGWTTSAFQGVMVDYSQGNAEAPAYLVYPGNYAYREIDTSVVPSLLGQTISFNFKISGSSVNTLCNFFFGVDQYGNGPMLRLDARSGVFSNIVTASSWTVWDAPTSGTTIMPNVWHAARIEITTSGYVQWYLDSVLQDTVPVTFKGNYIGIHGDAVVCSGAWFDDIVISGNTINTNELTWVNGSSTVTWINNL